MAHIATESVSKKVQSLIAKRFAEASPDSLMSFIFLDDMSKEVGEVVPFETFEAAAKAAKSNRLEMTIRTGDDFSPRPYIWFAPKPTERLSKLPDSVSVIRSPCRTQSMRVKEGILVFSKAGYAVAHMLSIDVGDFNVEDFSLDVLRRSGIDTVVLDYAGEEDMNIFPLT
jgi:hypothetical protein